MRYFTWCAPAAIVFLTGTIFSTTVAAEQDIDEFLDLGLEDLLSLEVTSVSKRRQPLNEAAAAIFVITQEDIQRSGVTSIPEALRMAPGLQVARIDGNKWAISSRGFNNQFANKLLVLIDGRSVYTPSYSGVYWDIQDTVLEDIDRIEVIRGPGATLWGANAVNGVINIITKNAADTEGGLLIAGAGNEEEGLASLRYGKKIGESTHGRAYLKYNKRDNNYAPTIDTNAGDNWKALRAGFRLDGSYQQRSQWTLQGDIYDNDGNERYMAPGGGPSVPGKIQANGWNLLGRLEHRFSDDSIGTLQVYYDKTQRDDSILGQNHDILDIDFQHQFRFLDRHDIIWGLGYRHIDDEFNNTANTFFTPAERTSELFSFMLQDEITLLPDKLRLTIGSKFEHNDFTGFEYQPSARLLWTPRQGHTVWSSVSRAVRTPARIEHDGNIATAVIPFIPLTVFTVGDDSVNSEVLMAYELGYRLQPRENLSLDLALFYNHYDEVQTFEPTSFIFFPVTLPSSFAFDNKLEADSHGLELAVEWRPAEWWRMQTNYTYIRLDTDYNDDSLDFLAASALEGSSPRHQVSIRSLMDLPNNVSLDMWGYYVDELPSASITSSVVIPDYFSFNARVAWRPVESIELSLIGQNIFQDNRSEFIGELQTFTEVERSFYGQLRWDF